VRGVAVVELRVGGHKSVWVWRDAFTQEECDALAADPSWPIEALAQTLSTDAKVANRIGALFAARMPGGPTGAWLPFVTYSRSSEPLSWHVDRARGATYKVYVYLTGGAGTVFRADSCGDEVLVPGMCGTLVCFDIALEHRGEVVVPRLPYPKLLLGLRLLATP
jgi:hypothetical protein